MLRTSLFSAVLALGILPACATERPVDELADETAADGQAGKGDAAGTFTFFRVEPDLRACSFDARCGGFFVSRPNRSTTICGRGSSGERCYVDSIDWSGTAMPESVAHSYEERLRAGETLILKGDIAPDPADRGSSLFVTEVWVPGSPNGVNDGVAVLVKDNGIRCIMAPCPSLTEHKLNSAQSAQLTDLDLAPSGADAETVARARTQLYQDGVLMFGDRYYPKKGAKGRAANQFYTRAPVPLF